jgi:hypothetical protein
MFHRFTSLLAFGSLPLLFALATCSNSSTTPNDTPGTFGYWCQVHTTYMQGAIYVVP